MNQKMSSSNGRNGSATARRPAPALPQRGTGKTR